MYGLRDRPQIVYGCVTGRRAFFSYFMFYGNVITSLGNERACRCVITSLGNERAGRCVITLLENKRVGHYGNVSVFVRYFP